jgi:RNA polymerase sigma-70 factor (ECF subfamily)
MPDGPLTARSRFEAAFEAHHRRVLAYCLRRLDSVDEAEDATAETFAVAWRRVADLPAPEAALPWLLAVARRVAANQRRGRRRLHHLVERLKAQPRPATTARPTSPAAEALARMRPEDQELLRLLAWDGLSQAETGEVLGISANAVAIRLHRARLRFADELARIEAAGSAGPGRERHERKPHRPDTHTPEGQAARSVTEERIG